MQQAKWQWEVQGADWPLREHSRFVEIGKLRWHIQHLKPASQAVQGGKPLRIVLLHGTFSSTHSFRKLAPILASAHEVLMPDLPGHGWTQGAQAPDMSMQSMANHLRALLEALQYEAAIFVGHSAGAALAIRLGLNTSRFVEAVISLNGALMPLAGVLGQVYSPAAQVLDWLPGLAQLTAWRSRHSDLVERLLAGTGSSLSAEDVSWYRRLASEPGHVRAVLDMMARWDLAGFAELLSSYEKPIALIGASRDATVPAAEIKRAALRLPQARCHVLRDLGHLAHEESPDVVASWILDLIKQL